MRISVVTISFNQVKYLKQCIDSVLSQNYCDIEYIVVDPGSTDGSREVVESYGNKINRIFQKDAGPADGLNKGFNVASGDIFCYLNSDDVFLPGAMTSVSKFFLKRKLVDVVCGHGHVIDGNSNYRRKVFSDSFSLGAAAYGAALAIQPSTFFRKEIYRRIGGFNVSNKSNWDGELLIDMALAKANIEILNEFLSCYRVHIESITGSARLADAHTAHTDKMFEKIMGRPYHKNDNLLKFFYRVKKHISNPVATLERVMHGPIFGSQN